MRVERESIAGIGIVVVGGLLLAALWNRILRPAFLTPSSKEIVEAFKDEGLEVYDAL